MTTGFDLVVGRAFLARKREVQAFRECYSGVGVFNWYYPSLPPQILRGSGVHLERKGLKS